MITQSSILEFLSQVDVKDDLQKEIKETTKAAEIVLIAGKSGCELTLDNLSKQVDLLKKKKEDESEALSTQETLALDSLKYFHHQILEELEKRALSLEGWQ